MSTSSFDSESLVRRHVCGLWASLWLGSFGGLLTEQPGVIGPLPAPRRVVGGLLTEDPGVIGPLPAPWRVVGGRWVGCRLTNPGLSDRCRHRGRWLGAGWVVVRRSWGYRTAAGTAAGGWGSFGGLLSEDPGVIGPLPAPRQMVRGRVGCCPKILGLSDRCLHRGRWLGAGWVVVRRSWGYRTAAGTAAGGWGSFGGLLSEDPGVIGPLPAPRQMVRGRVGCCPNNSGYRTAADSVAGG